MELRKQKTALRSGWLWSAGVGGVSVGVQFVLVVDTAAVDDTDDEFAGPFRSPRANAVISIVIIFGDQIAVFVVDVEVEVGIAVTVDYDTGLFAAVEDDFVFVFFFYIVLMFPLMIVPGQTHF